MKRSGCVAMTCVLLFGSAGYANLLGRYFAGVNIDPNGILQTEGLVERFSRIDAHIDFWNGSRYWMWQPIAGQGDNYTVEWTGYIRIERPGEYGFGTISDDGSQIWIDGRLVVDNGEGQWYDWEDNITEYEAGEPNQPVYLSCGYHAIRVRFYDGPVYDGVELWWLLPDSGPSDIPYYGTTFHGVPPTYNPNTNWNIVPATALYAPDEYQAMVCALDLNGDDIINFYEFSVLAGQWQSTSPVYGDFTGNGRLELEDLALFLNFWLAVCNP